MNFSNVNLWPFYAMSNKPLITFPTPSCESNLNCNGMQNQESFIKLYKLVSYNN